MILNVTALKIKTEYWKMEKIIGKAREICHQTMWEPWVSFGETSIDWPEASHTTLAVKTSL